MTIVRFIPDNFQRTTPSILNLSISKQFKYDISHCPTEKQKSKFKKQSNRMCGIPSVLRNRLH